MTAPYSNPLPPKPPWVSDPPLVIQQSDPSPPVQKSDPPTIQKVEPAKTQVRITVPKPRAEKAKYTTLSLDQDLTVQVQAFADAQGLPSLNDGIRTLLRAALSSEPSLAAIGVGWQKGYWQGRMAFFEAANNFIEDQRKVITALQQEASLYMQGNPIHIPGEQPPVW